jgi:serine/threonine-protein kinase
MIGKTIGTYKITGTIGSGGMGEVFVGEDLMLERQVAIKQLRPELASRPDVVERFRAEAVILAKLQHTNIATVYAFIQESGNFFLVMEYVQGWTLQHVLQVCGALAPVVAGGLFQQALDGIGFAHRRHIVHRDLKPANVMLTDGGVIKVMDFGLARVLGSTHLTRLGRLVGTLEYISPEQIRGEATDARSDIYSLGILLYELVTGRLPFESHSEYALIRAHVEAPPPSPRQIMPALSAELEQIILRALSKDPPERFQSTEAFSLALARCLPQMDTHLALTALLGVLKTNTLKTEPATSHIQETPHALQPIASAQMKATRFANSANLNGTDLLSSRHPRSWKRYLVPALILASSVATAGLLVFLGMLHTPRGPGLLPKPPGEIASPSTSPLPVAPQSSDNGVTPLQSESSDEPAPPGAAVMPTQVGTTDERRIPVSAPRPSPSESMEGIAAGRSAPSQGASEPPARGKSDTLGETLPQPIATIPPMDTPRKLGAVEEGATRASAPREEPQQALPAGLPLPKTDAESQGGTQYVPPQESTNPQNTPSKVPDPNNPSEKDPGSAGTSLRDSGRGRVKARSAGTARSSHDAPAQPSSKEGPQGSGTWYIKK